MTAKDKILSAVEDIQSLLDDIEIATKQILDDETSTKPIHKARIDKFDGHEVIKWHATNFSDIELMEELAECVKRTSVANVISVLKSH